MRVACDARGASAHEHQEIDERIEDMQKLNPAGDAWIGKAKELSHEVHHHLREKEKMFFQVSAKILSDAQKTRLAKQYRRDYLRMHKVLAAR